MLTPQLIIKKNICRLIALNYNEHAITFRLEQDSEEDGELVNGLLELELEAKNSAGKLSEKIQEKFTELSVAISHMDKQVGQVANQWSILNEVKVGIAELVLTQQISACLKEALECKMCASTPVTLVVVTACCGQVAGCSSCMETYLKENDSCLFCKAGAFATKLIFLKGFSQILDDLK